MKYYYLLILPFLLQFGCSPVPEDILLARDQKSDYAIVVSQNADSLSQQSAEEIQNYIFKISGAKLEITHNLDVNKKHLLIGRASLTDSLLLSELDSLPEDGFLIHMDDQNIIVSGRDEKSNIYAAYTFIEEFLGCMLLAPHEEIIPQQKQIVLPKIHKIYKPAFSFRRMLFPGLFDRKYQYWHKVEELDEWGMFVHTFQHLVPPEKYFKTHPEYFSLVGGNRLSDAQLCLSNPRVIALLKENLRKEMDKNPGKKYWSVSQNDAYNYCECANCQAMYDRYENISGAYIAMANDLAREFPDKQISTLAYQFTRSAPKNIQPLDHVNIMFCSIECNRSMPLESDPRSTEFVKDMKDWSALTDNIFLWDYVVQFKNYLTPFPNFHVIQPNIRFFRNNHVRMMFQQGSSRNWSDLAELKQYLIAKLLWDPDLDLDALTKEFIEKYYGPSSQFIQSYYDLTHKAIIENQEKEFLNIYGFPADYFDSYLSPELLIQYKSLMDQAEEACKNDSIYLKRVRRTRLPVDFAYLDIALNKDTMELSYFDKSGQKPTIKPEMIRYLDRFVELSKITETTRINERNFLTEEYRAYVLRKLELMTRENKAKGARIKLLTTPSETYPVGGVKALTDGLFGDLDFHNNWLGFQGNDMIVEIDLREPMIIHQVNMNFLKAVNSWVFLPEEVIVDVSPDGNKYIQAGSLTGDNTDQNYLVKAIPFTLNFDPVETRYLRVKASSMKECPDWHRGFGNPSWIFIDELIVE